MEKAAEMNLSGDESDWSSGGGSSTRGALFEDVGAVNDCVDSKRCFEQSETETEPKKLKTSSDTPPQSEDAVCSNGSSSPDQYLGPSSVDCSTSTATTLQQQEPVIPEPAVAIQIAPILGEPFSLNVSPSATVYDIKDMISEKMDILVENQMLSVGLGHNKQQLLTNDDLTVRSLGLREGTKLNLFVQMNTGNDCLREPSDLDQEEESLLLYFCNPEELFIFKIAMEDDDQQQPQIQKIQIQRPESQTQHSPKCEDQVPKPEPSLKVIPTVCAVCERKLRVTNTFTCKCGNIYCRLHRYNDQHNCTFDYRSAGRAELEKMNPLVAKPKIQFL